MRFQYLLTGLVTALIVAPPVQSEEPWRPSEGEFKSACTSSRIEEGGLTLAQIDTQCLFDYHKHVVAILEEPLPESFQDRCETSMYRAIHTDFPNEKERATSLARSTCLDMKDSLISVSNGIAE